jgi:hypothetical protein
MRTYGLHGLYAAFVMGIRGFIQRESTARYGHSAMAPFARPVVLGSISVALRVTAPFWLSIFVVPSLGLPARLETSSPTLLLPSVTGVSPSLPSASLMVEMCAIWARLCQLHTTYSENQSGILIYEHW